MHNVLPKILTGNSSRFMFYPGRSEPPNSDFNNTFHGIHDAIVKHRIELPDDIGIYVHIPFCRSLCSFCPYTKMLYSSEVAQRYFDSLCMELKELSESLGDTKVSSLYFGGGTPLTMPEAIESVIKIMYPHFLPAAGIAVEIHPDDIDFKSLDWLKQVGVTMVSLGVESFNQSVLNILGRGYSSQKARDALKTIMKVGFDTVNVDLITCIPGQTLDQIVVDFQDLLDYGVGQISAYPLIDFSFTALASPYSVKDQIKVLSALSCLGDVQNYQRSSVWTWTKPSVNTYTSITREAFIGIGAGAATYLDGYFGINTFDISSYIDCSFFGEPRTALYSFLTPEESALYWLFWRCYEGEIDLNSPYARRLKNLPKLFRLAHGLGLIEKVSSSSSINLSQTRNPMVSEPVFHLTQRGFILYHFLERYYTRNYIGRLWEICRASSFPGKVIL